MRFTFTQRGQLFAGVLALLSLASLTSQSALLLLPVGIIIGCYLLNVRAAWKVIRNLQVTAPGTMHLAEGQRMTQPWRVSNGGSSVAQFISVEAGDQVLLRLMEVAPGNSAHVIPDVVYLRRGVYSLSELQFCSTAPFGLVKVSDRLKLEGEVIVHPAIFHTTAPAAAGFDAVVGGKYSGKRQSASGALFAGVRPFQPGDPFKHIHWKSSAKGADLMVKTFDEELSGRVAVIVDAGHSGNEIALDDCLRAAGSLIFAALDEGHHVEWIDLTNMKARLVPPFADGQEVLDDLARIQPGKGCIELEHLRTAIQKCSPRAAVCIVATEANEALENFLAELVEQRRKVSLHLPESCTRTQRVGGVTELRYSAHAIEHVE